MRSAEVRVSPMLMALLACVEAPPPEFDVLLVSIDGTPRTLLDEEWETLVTLPSIAAEGTRQNLLVQGVTDTIASHARILTGYGPDVTGVTSARNFGPIPAGLSVPERLRRRFGSPLHILYQVNKPFMLGIQDENAPFWNLAQACDIAENFQMMEKVTPLMLDALETVGDDPFFAFFHWAAVDQTGHHYLEGSAEQRAALHEVDAHLGEVRDALVAMGRWERTLVYVTTDHGFPQGGHAHYAESDEVWLITTDPDVGLGNYIDQLPWTILERYGIDEVDPPRPLSPL